MPRPTHSGLLTAGSLWTPLHDETTFEENIDNLIVQITKELTTSNPDEQDEEVENDPGQDLFSVEDIKGEIERMREDMAPGDAAAASKSSSGDTLAAIPSLSPQLPRGVFVSKEMQELQEQLTTTSCVRVGFVGMGGIVSSRRYAEPQPHADCN